MITITTKRLIALLEDSNLSYSELSSRTGVSKSSLQRYFTGKTTKIPVPVVEKLAAVFGVHTAYLMGWVDDPNYTETEKAATNDGDGLSESQRELMEFARGLSEEQAERALQILTLALQGLE